MSDLIKQYRILHRNNKKYGKSSEKLKDIIQPFVDELNPSVILDYGCGKSRLLESLNTSAKLLRYDPAIRQYATYPSTPVEFIINTDVLEHIPEEQLDSVLTHISKSSDKVFFCICLAKAVNNLPDGTNCHKTVKPSQWWKEKLNTYFPVIKEHPYPGGRNAVFTTWT